MSDTAVGAAFSPTSSQERYEFLDALRGFALIGIVLANMVSYSLYLYLSEAERARIPTASSDPWFDFLELLLIEGKFYTIFSILFGVGFSILITRAAAKSMVFPRFFLRRMLMLFLIGLGHAVLFWHNDILAAYALCGALLLPLASARNRTILSCAAVSYAVPIVLLMAEAIPEGTFLGPRDVLFEWFGFTRESRVEVWASGSFPDIVLLNLGSWFGQVDYLITSGMIFRIYGCFLLGYYIGRSGLHRKLHEHARWIRRIAVAGLAIGLPLNVAFARTFESEGLLHSTVATFAILPLSAAYVCLLALVWLRAERIIAATFAPVGRMALTNYIGQSVICMLIFRGVGFGLGGRIGPTLYLPIGAAVYLLQLAASRAWLTRFQFGPAEWIWRMLTYGRSVPLTRPANQVSGLKSV